jgi:hypothetical protein
MAFDLSIPSGPLSPKPGSAQFGFLIASWFLFTVAALVMLLLIVNLYKQYNLLRLPVTRGLMLWCKPLLTHDRMTSRDSHPNPVWTVVARFRYTVEGMTFESENFANIQIRTFVWLVHVDEKPPKSIARICEQYAEGSSVSVHYRPQNPKLSFVYFSSPLWDWPWVLFPTIAGLLGWFCLFCSRIK